MVLNHEWAGVKTGFTFAWLESSDMGLISFYKKWFPWNLFSRQLKKKKKKEIRDVVQFAQIVSPKSLPFCKNENFYNLTTVCHNPTNFIGKCTRVLLLLGTLLHIREKEGGKENIHKKWSSVQRGKGPSVPLKTWGLVPTRGLGA